jgi:hypothetical protein
VVNDGTQYLRFFSKHMQRCRSLSSGTIMPAAYTVRIRNLYSVEASLTDRGCLKLTLRTEMTAGHDLRATVWARKKSRPSQKNINYRADSNRHNEHNQHPQTRWHPTTFDVLAHIPDEQNIASQHGSPRVSRQQPHEQHLVSTVGQHAMKEVLNSGKYKDRQCNRPTRN